MLRTLALLLSILVGLAGAQFGTNKVQYAKKKWKTIRSTHFDIYYAENSRELAAHAAPRLEKALDSISRSIRYNIKKRIPVIIYKSPSDFQETNVIQEEIGEGTGGFTEIFKSRVVVPFDGSFNDFDHVLHHELTHAVMYDLIFENVFNAFRYRASFQMPLWAAEGWAEYESAGWNLESDMYLMDAVISGYIDEPMNEFGSMYLAYKAGMAFYNFLEKQYGRQCIGDFLKYLSAYKNVDKAFKRATRTEIKKAGEIFLLDLKKKYWPELGRRDNASEVARKLTRHRAAGYFTVQPEKDPLANFNLQPSVSPDGRHIVYFSDLSDYPAIYLMDASTGKVLGPLAESESSDQFESFHFFKTRIAWSPDGKRILFSAKSEGRDVLKILEVKTRRLIRTLPVRMDGIEYPDWSPDGNHVAFGGLDRGQSDIYVFDLQSGTLHKLTSDPNYDSHPSFSPDGNRIVFQSETGDRRFGSNGLDLYLIGRDGKGLSRLTDNPFDDFMPVFAPQENRVYFVSNRSGIANLYVMSLDSLLPHPVTNVFSGVSGFSLARQGDFAALSVFENGGWDIYRLDRPLSHARDTALPLTDYARSLADTAFVFWRKARVPAAPVTDSAAKKGVLDRDSTGGDSLSASRAAAPEADSASADDADTTDYDEGPRFIDPFDPYGRNDDPFAPSSSMRQRSRRKAPPADTSAFIHDTLEFKNRNGTYREKDYVPQFTFDAVSAMVGGAFSPNGAAFGGQTALALSDILGNHHIYLAANIYGNSMENPLDALNGYFSYAYLPYRTDMGLTLYRYVNIFGGADSDLAYDFYIDALHNGSLDARYPFSRFLRIEGSLGFTYISRSVERWSRRATDQDFAYEKRSRVRSVLNTDVSSALVFDNTLWGITGPVNGGRLRLSGLMVPPGESGDYGYGVAVLDGRRYFHFLKKYVLALRLSAGASHPMMGGLNPKLFYLGGVPDNIAYFFVPYMMDNSIETNYFSSIVMPLRGYTLGAANPRGNTQFALANMEFRFPFISNLAFYFPLPISIRYIMGALFMDVGGAWDDVSEFRPFRESPNSALNFNDLKGGAGFGLRVNLFNMLVLKWDRAFKLGRDSGREDYISIGAEF